MRAADLRFTSEEACAFLNQMMNLKLSMENIAALEASTEGWIAGLQLTGLSMHGHQDTASFIKSFTGSQCYEDNNLELGAFRHAVAANDNELRGSSYPPMLPRTRMISLPGAGGYSTCRA